MCLINISSWRHYPWDSCNWRNNLWKSFCTWTFFSEQIVFKAISVVGKLAIQVSVDNTCWCSLKLNGEVSMMKSIGLAPPKDLDCADGNFCYLTCLPCLSLLAALTSCRKSLHIASFHILPFFLVGCVYITQSLKNKKRKASFSKEVSLLSGLGWLHRKHILILYPDATLLPHTNFHSFACGWRGKVYFCF